MTNDEARSILQAYRPNGADANDPRFREALEQAGRDPELGRWFAREQALDASTCAKLLRAFTPPADLKAQLLAQHRITPPVARWRQPAWQFAAAACIALLVTLATFGLRSPRAGEFASYRQTMAGFTAHKLDRLDFVSRDIGDVRRWLAGNQSHGDLVLPAGIEGRPSLGCRILDWQGHKVALICFELENRHIAHLLVIDRATLRQPPGESPVFEQVGDMGTVSWSRGAKTYVLAAKDGDQLDLIKLI